MVPLLLTVWAPCYRMMANRECEFVRLGIDVNPEGCVIAFFFFFFFWGGGGGGWLCFVLFFVFIFFLARPAPTTSYWHIWLLNHQNPTGPMGKCPCCQMASPPLLFDLAMKHDFFLPFHSGLVLSIGNVWKEQRRFFMTVFKKVDASVVRYNGAHPYGNFLMIYIL